MLDPTQNRSPCHVLLPPQEATAGLLRQISELAAPGSRLCFDAVHADYIDGRKRSRGYWCGAQVRPFGLPLTLHMHH